jgi:hypothetical protein
MEDLQVVLDRAAGPLVLQDVVGHAEPAGREHRVAVAIALERAWLADQPVDHVTVIDPVPAPAAKPRQAVDLLGTVPDVKMIDPDVNIDLLTDQTAGQRVDVATHVDRAARIDFRRDPPRHLQPPRRQGPQRGPLFEEAVTAVGVASGHDLLEEHMVLATTGEIPAPSQHQGLVDGLLEPVVALLDVAILVGFPRLDRLGLDSVMGEQRLIALGECLGIRIGVNGGAHAVGAMPCGNASQFPEGILQPFAQTLEALAEADRAGLPVGVSEHEVIDQVVEGLAGDRDAEFGHVSEVGSGQPTRLMVLCEEDLLGRPFPGAPEFDPSLQTAELNIGESAGKAVLQVEKQGPCLKSRIEPELRFEIGPNVEERIRAGPPVSRRTALAGEPIRVAVLACRFLVDPRLVGDLGQSRFGLKQRPQPPELPVSKHPFAPGQRSRKRTAYRGSRPGNLGRVDNI